MNNQQLTEKFYTQEVENLQKVADESYDILVAKKTNPRIPEDVFKHHFLNYFTGHGKVEPSRNIIAEWVSVAGSVTNSVDVFDQTTKEILFTVPPIMDTSNIRTKKEGNKTMIELNLEHSIVKNSFPGAGARFVNTTMVEKAKSLVGGTLDTTKAEQQWIAIHDRYFGSGDVKTEKPNTSTDTGDLYEFD